MDRDASAGFLDSPARGTYQVRVACGWRELLAAATTPLPRRSPLELVEEPIVLAHAASHGPPGRARACVNPPALSIAGDAKGPQWRPGGNRPVAGTRTVSRCTCRERLVAALCHGARASVTRRWLWTVPPSPSCTRRARSALDTHREALETAHDRRVPVAGLRSRKRNPLDSRGGGRDHGAGLHACELGADALVHSMPERCVLGPLRAMSS